MKAAVLPAVRVPNVIQLARLFGAAWITHLVRCGIRLQGSYGARVRGDMPEIVALAAAGRISVTQPISAAIAWTRRTRRTGPSTAARLPAGPSSS